MHSVTSSSDVLPRSNITPASSARGYSGRSETRLSKSVHCIDQDIRKLIKKRNHMQKQLEQVEKKQQEEAYTVEKNKHRQKQEIKEILSLKVKIEEKIPEHRCYNLISKDFTSVNMILKAQAHSGLMKIQQKKKDEQNKLQVVKTQLDCRLNVLKRVNLKAVEVRRVLEEKKVKISELREYISKYKDKKAYEKQLERNAVQTLEGRFREVNCVYNLEMLICLESKMRKLDSESSSTDLYSLNDTLKRYAKKMKKLNRMMGMSIDSKMNDFPKVYDVALQTWADLAIDLDNGNILETIQQSIMNLITKQQMRQESLISKKLQLIGENKEKLVNRDDNVGQIDRIEYARDFKGDLTEEESKKVDDLFRFKYWDLKLQQIQEMKFSSMAYSFRIYQTLKDINIRHMVVVKELCCLMGNENFNSDDEPCFTPSLLQQLQNVEELCLDQMHRNRKYELKFVPKAEKQKVTPNNFIKKLKYKTNDSRQRAN